MPAGPGQLATTLLAVRSAYPEPEPGARRPAPNLPYLFGTPDDFALSLWFDGGGALAAGKLAIDAKGNVWTGVNWMPGSQSGVATDIGGGTAEFAPDGTPLSPPITGVTGDSHWYSANNLTYQEREDRRSLAAFSRCRCPPSAAI